MSATWHNKMCPLKLNNIFSAISHIMCSPEPKAHRWAYGIPMLVVAHHFQTSSPPIPLGQSKPNRRHAHLFLRNRQSDFHENWGLLSIIACINNDPGVTLTLMWVLKVNVIFWPWPKVIYVWKLKHDFLTNPWAVCNQILYLNLLIWCWSHDHTMLVTWPRLPTRPYRWAYSIPMLRRPSLSSTIFKHLLLLNRLANQSKIVCGASLGRGNQNLINGPGHMTMMAVTPIYGKKSSSPEPAGRFLRKLGTPVHHSLYKWWPWSDLGLFYGKVNFGHLGFSMGKKWKQWIFQKLLQLVTWKSL